ncbi:MAG TPA: 5'/3'-nucleotidase SurE [Pirellulaceae bacterium]|nr:5'/3'-nucleotidase SurE [Pirellulaceae bacterium]
MKILLTNDDGIDAPGLEALATAASEFGELIFVAPDRHLSGCSHQATTHRPLVVTELGPNRYSTDGTPADCVRLALLHLAPDIDYVLSGVNDGGNLGVDVWLSGTCAAAREATFFGKPAIAISQYRRRGSHFQTERAARWAKAVIEQLLRDQQRELSSFWNVNLPDPPVDDEFPEIRECQLGLRPLPVAYETRAGQFHYSGIYQLREREVGSDVEACFAGAIAVTRIRLFGGR